MQAIIEMAGGVNAVQGFENFMPLTSESLVEANPDAVLMFSSSVQSLEGDQGVLDIPGMRQTNAGRNNAIIAMDGPMLSSFGPRLGQAAKELNEHLHTLSR